MVDLAKPVGRRGENGGEAPNRDTGGDTPKEVQINWDALLGSGAGTGPNYNLPETPPSDASFAPPPNPWAPGPLPPGVSVGPAATAYQMAYPSQVVAPNPGAFWFQPAGSNSGEPGNNGGIPRDQGVPPPEGPTYPGGGGSGGSGDSGGDSTPKEVQINWDAILGEPGNNGGIPRDQGPQLDFSFVPKFDVAPPEEAPTPRDTGSTPKEEASKEEEEEEPKLDLRALGIDPYFGLYTEPGMRR